MGKQIALIVWSLLYGETLAYVVAALDGHKFQPVPAAIYSVIAGLIIINVLALFVRPQKQKKQKPQS